jgi:hypothetical protein
MMVVIFKMPWDPRVFKIPWDPRVFKIPWDPRVFKIPWDPRVFKIPWDPRASLRVPLSEVKCEHRRILIPAFCRQLPRLC